jgi:hypothetical protein
MLQAENNAHLLLQLQQLLLLSKCLCADVVVLLDQPADLLVHDVDGIHAHARAILLFPWVLEHTELRDQILVLLSQSRNPPLVSFDLSPCRLLRRLAVTLCRCYPRAHTQTAVSQRRAQKMEPRNHSSVCTAPHPANGPQAIKSDDARVGRNRRHNITPCCQGRVWERKAEMCGHGEADNRCQAPMCTYGHIENVTGALLGLGWWA